MHVIPTSASVHGASLPFAPPACEPVAPGSRDIAVEDLTIRCLRRQDEIRDVAHLRGHIDLKAAVAADPRFASREKKETSLASSLLSSFMIA